MIFNSFLSFAFIALFLSFILSEICIKLKYPRVIGQIITGVVLSLPIFNIILSSENQSTLEFMANLGVIFLMLLTGLSINLKKLKEAEKDSIILAISGVITSFGLGYLATRLAGFDNTVALIVGGCLSLTAEGTSIEVLLDLKAINTKIGSIIISTGLMDDIFEFLFLFLTMASINNTYSSGGNFLVSILAFAIIIFILFKSIPLFLRVVHKDHKEFSSFSLVIILGLAVAVIAAEFSLSSIIGALIAGALLNHFENDKKEHREHIKLLELITFSLLIPFFFINVGIKADLTSVAMNIPLVLLIISVAIIGKLLGVFIMKPFTDLSWKQLNLIGWALNSRGMMGLVIANFAFIAGLIPIEIFSAVVIMALVTTIIFPIIIKQIARDRSIWH